jgi:predicted small integral membrane protein
VTAPSGVTSLTATPGGTLALTTASGIYLLPAGATQWKQASVASAPDGGFSYVGMTTNDQGVALPANASLHGIWMTFNGGQTWAARTTITPGN